MSTLKGSQPFSYSRDEVIRQLEKLALVVIGVFGTWFGASFLPFLKDHVANDFGGLIVLLLGAGVPYVLDCLNKFMGDTTKSPSGAITLRAKAPLAFFAAGTMLIAGGASAADIAVIVPSTPGNYLLVIDGTGNAVLSPLGQVVRLNGPPTPPVPPPTPTPLTDRAIQIRDAASKVTGDSDRATTAHGLAKLYRDILAMGIQDPSTLQLALSIGADKFLSDPGFLAAHGATATAGWKPVRDVFGNQWTLLANRQALDPSKPPPTLQDFVALTGEVANGLDASAPSANGAGFTINPDTLKLILQIIQIIMQLLQPTPVSGH